MIVFLDFEASSLGKRSYPIEVAWVFHNGDEEGHLISPAPDWTDWSEEAEAIHHISRATLMRDGKSPHIVAQRMIEALDGHDLVASAPSWDGKWLSTLLRASGLGRHRLRLRRSRDARLDCARRLLATVLPAERLDAEASALVNDLDTQARAGQPPAHRALPDAQEERRRWLAVEAAAAQIVAQARS